MGAFVRVTRVGQVPPGRLKRVEVAGRLVCLANVDGHIYAVDDDCTHISGPLDQGDLSGCVLECPLHLARFDVRTGEVLRGPARDDLPTYAVRVEGDDVLVEEPDRAQSGAGMGGIAGMVAGSSNSPGDWRHAIHGITRPTV